MKPDAATEHDKTAKLRKAIVLAIDSDKSIKLNAGSSIEAFTELCIKNSSDLSDLQTAERDSGRKRLKAGISGIQVRACLAHGDFTSFLQIVADETGRTFDPRESNRTARPIRGWLASRLKRKITNAVIRKDPAVVKELMNGDIYRDFEALQTWPAFVRAYSPPSGCTAKARCKRGLSSFQSAMGNLEAEDVLALEDDVNSLLEEFRAKVKSIKAETGAETVPDNPAATKQPHCTPHESNAPKPRKSKSRLESSKGATNKPNDTPELRLQI